MCSGHQHDTVQYCTERTATVGLCLTCVQNTFSACAGEMVWGMLSSALRNVPDTFVRKKHDLTHPIFCWGHGRRTCCATRTPRHIERPGPLLPARWPSATARVRCSGSAGPRRERRRPIQFGRCPSREVEAHPSRPVQRRLRGGKPSAGKLAMHLGADPSGPASVGIP